MRNVMCQVLLSVLFTITGVIENFDETKVVLQTEAGKVAVLRNQFGKRVLRPGEKVELSVSPKALQMGR